MIPVEVLPEQAWTVALLALPKLGPSRLSQLADQYGTREAWARLCGGQPVNVDGVRSATIDAWRNTARAMSVADHWEAIAGLGVRVDARGSSGYPERLETDIEPPALLFSLGAPDGCLAPAAATVGIVGTRKCTSYGQRVAFELGAALIESGVSVISGLAKGIDAAAHRGALSAVGPHTGRLVGVVGSGLDVIYPRANADLWAAVPRHGVLLSETPPGVGPESWRFPARNRIIAGLSDAVIVVESHAKGGSLITVDEAQARDVAVGAVPGPVTSNAAGGSNRLLVDGATPILDVSDVHALIGYTPPRRVDEVKGADVQSAVLDALGWTPVTFEQLCGSLRLPTADVARELEQLIGLGLCARQGVWIERTR